MVIKLRWSTNFIPKLCFHYSCCPHTSMQNIILHINREPLVYFKKSFTHAGIQKTLETGGIIEDDERTKETSVGWFASAKEDSSETNRKTH